MSREKKNQNASKRGTIETSSLRFARSKPQKNQNASKRGTIETSSLRFARSKPQKKLATVSVGHFSLEKRRLKHCSTSITEQVLLSHCHTLVTQ